MRLLLQVEVAEQLADRLRAHPAAEVHAEPVRRAEAVLELAEELLVVDDLLDVELAEELPRVLEPADALDRRLARVLAAALDVGDHLLDLRRPVLDGLEVLLAGALDEAEVVRELAHLLGAGVGVGLLEHVAQEAVAGLACALEVLRVDRRDELGVVARRARSPESSWSSTLCRCFVMAPFFAPEALSSSARSGSSAARISCAAVPTDSISRGASRRSSRVAVWRTSSRSRLGSSPATVFARSGKIAAGERRAPPRVRASPGPRPSSRARGPRTRRPRRSPCPCLRRDSRDGASSGRRARRAARRGRRRSARTRREPCPRGRRGRRRASPGRRP